MSHASPQWRPESRQPEHLCDIRKRAAEAL